MKNNMLMIFVTMTLLFSTACTRIEPGHVGIKINMAGDNRGADKIPTESGWVFYIPGFTQVLEYPTFIQTTSWTKDVTEGSPSNEEICFNTKNNVNACVDISLSYYIEASRVPEFYVKFRNDDLNAFTHGFYRNVARDAFNEVGAKYADEDVSSHKKDAFLKEVRQFVVANTDKYGIQLEQFGFIGALRLPDNIVKAMNDKVAAVQRAQQAENELRTAQANAQIRIAAAQGEAEANRLLTNSLDDRLLRWQELSIIRDKWDGKSPLVTSGGVLPTLSIDKR